MFLRPNKVKFDKCFKKPSKKRIHWRANRILNGVYALQSLQKEYITARQIEATRRAITSTMKRKGKVWIRIFPARPITSKPLESRMGKGKGSVDYWVAEVNAGTILFEVVGSNEPLILKALEYAQKKLPLQTRIKKRPIV